MRDILFGIVSFQSLQRTIVYQPAARPWFMYRPNTLADLLSFGFVFVLFPDATHGLQLGNVHTSIHKEPA